jgi:hypothetical protein
MNILNLLVFDFLSLDYGHEPDNIQLGASIRHSTYAQIIATFPNE